MAVVSSEDGRLVSLNMFRLTLDYDRIHNVLNFKSFDGICFFDFLFHRYYLLWNLLTELLLIRVSILSRGTMRSHNKYMRH